MKHPYVKAYSLCMGDFTETMQAAVALAAKENAPEDAVYRKDDGTWATLKDLTVNSLLQKITLRGKEIAGLDTGKRKVVNCQRCKRDLPLQAFPRLFSGGRGRTVAYRQTCQRCITYKEMKAYEYKTPKKYQS